MEFTPEEPEVPSSDETGGKKSVQGHEEMDVNLASLAVVNGTAILEVENVPHELSPRSFAACVEERGASSLRQFAQSVIAEFNGNDIPYELLENETSGGAADPEGLSKTNKGDRDDEMNGKITPKVPHRFKEDMQLLPSNDNFFPSTPRSDESEGNPLLSLALRTDVDQTAYTKAWQDSDDDTFEDSLDFVVDDFSPSSSASFITVMSGADSTHTLVGEDSLPSTSTSDEQDLLDSVETIVDEDGFVDIPLPPPGTNVYLNLTMCDKPEVDEEKEVYAASPAEIEKDLELLATAPTQSSFDKEVEELVVAIQNLKIQLFPDDSPVVTADSFAVAPIQKAPKTASGPFMEPFDYMGGAGEGPSRLIRRNVNKSPAPEEVEKVEVPKKSPQLARRKQD